MSPSEHKSMTWYADEAAKQVHAAFQEGLRHMLAQLMPGYELSHMGVNKIENAPPCREPEVRIILHLNPIGRVKVRPESFDLTRLS